MKDIIKRLHAERKRIDKAIAALESIQGSGEHKPRATTVKPLVGRPRKTSSPVADAAFGKHTDGAV